MYQQIGDILAISVNDWLQAGLTYDQFRNDSRSGLLNIARRGLEGNTLIDVHSIKRPDRLKKIEEVCGKIDSTKETGLYSIETDTEARDYYTKYRYGSNKPLTMDTVNEYTSRASIFNALREGLQRHREARATAGKRVNMGEYWSQMLEWYRDRCLEMRLTPLSNARCLERAYKNYCNGGYPALIHKNYGNDNSRVVSTKMENLFISLWRMNGKPFVNRVHELYLDFVSGTKELYDPETGEVFHPEDFRYKGRAREVSLSTVWNYLKNVINYTAVFADRNGHFEYANKLRPKHNRHVGKYSLSKISMDDVALSRKSVRGWVYKYIAVDVVSGYYFRPAYVVGKPTIDTVYESFRNMFCELMTLGLPMPGELEVEHHLMKDIPDLDKYFSFVRFCTSPTEKRAEHNIRSLKYGTAHDAGHTRGRWYAKNEAFRSVRNKVNGDYVEPVYQPQTIVADDLADIEEHNNELHPLQKTYPGLTRRQVLIRQINPDLRGIDRSYLLKFIGNMTETSIRNNDYCAVSNTECEIKDFAVLKRLQPNNYNVTAYWLPEDDGSIASVYLYQGDTYIGEAVNRSQFEYNECAVERTGEDDDKMLHQNKRASKFDKMIRTKRSEIGRVGVSDTSLAAAVREVPLDVVENVQPAGYEEDEFTVVDYAAKAKNDF